MSLMKLFSRSILKQLMQLDEFKAAVTEYVSPLIPKATVEFSEPGVIQFPLSENKAAIQFTPDLEAQAGNSVEWNGGTGSDDDTQLPYKRSAYFLSNGAFHTGVPVIMSNKRMGYHGNIQGVSALPDGTEPSMLAVSPDVNGPCIAIESVSELVSGNENQSAIAIYDLNDINGGQTTHSFGYGKKKWEIVGNGAMYWGTNLSNNPAANADIATIYPANGKLNLKGDINIEGRLFINGIQFTVNDSAL